VARLRFPGGTTGRGGTANEEVQAMQGNVIDHPSVYSSYKPYDLVVTPSGRTAMVKGYYHDRLDLEYMDDQERVVLRPELVTLLKKGER